MSPDSRYVLTVAGLDPTAGAGILADIKTIEHIGCYGLAACTALTSQTESEFLEMHPFDCENVRKQFLPIIERYSLSAVKIGLTNDIFLLRDVIQEIREALPEVPLVWDPILQSSSGYIFYETLDNAALSEILSACTVVTPNQEEILFFDQELSDPHLIAKSLSGQYCPVLLKGGHDQFSMQVTDSLYIHGEGISFSTERLSGPGKHGSGCVHSSALAAYLALGFDLPSAVEKAFQYMQSFLKTGQGLLGRQSESDGIQAR